MGNKKPVGLKILNELARRDKNTEASKSIKKYFHNKKDIVKSPIPFVCECSDITCDKHVKVSIVDYEKIHKRGDRFITKKGHDTPSVEKVIEHKDGFDTVEKFELAP